MKFRNLRLKIFLKKQNIEIIQIWKVRRYFLAGLKALLDEGGRGILLGDNTGSRAVIQQRITFQRVEI
jgi:hypothetical protein